MAKLLSNDGEKKCYQIIERITENAKVVHVFTMIDKLIGKGKKEFSALELDKLFGRYQWLLERETALGIYRCLDQYKTSPGFLKLVNCLASHGMLSHFDVTNVGIKRNKEKNCFEYGSTLSRYLDKANTIRNSNLAHSKPEITIGDYSFYDLTTQERECFGDLITDYVNQLVQYCNENHSLQWRLTPKPSQYYDGLSTEIKELDHFYQFIAPKLRSAK